jgi:DNA invertase Pin-like site-specific DNA recombinase
MPPESPPAELVDAFGYIRVSMMREEAISPETQQAAIEACAKRLGYRIVDWIIDLDKTGRNFKRKITRTIDRVADGEAAAILVWKYSRFGRQRSGNAEHLAKLENAGGRLISATEDIDTSTATGKFSRALLLEFAAFESDRAGEIWAEVYDYRVRKGLPTHGRPRFGYRQAGRVPDEKNPKRTRHVKGDDERYEPDPDTGDVLAGMYRDYISGTGFTTIARRLTEDGWRTSYGNPWRADAVRDVLDSGFGAGFLLLHDPACRCTRKTRCRRKIHVRGAHDPVITGEEWLAYQDRRNATRELPPRARVPVFPVSGMVRCGHCRGAMAATGDGAGGAPVFKCLRHRKYADCDGRPSVTVTRLVEAAREYAAELATDIDRVAREAAVRQQARGPAPTAAAVAEKKLREAERELVRLARERGRGDGDIPDDAWKAAAAEARADRDAAAAEMEALRARERQMEASRDVPRLLPSLLADWDTLPPGALNAILRKLARRIVVHRDGERVRDGKGHWLPMPVRIEIHPAWEPDPWETDDDLDWFCKQDHRKCLLC